MCVRVLEGSYTVRGRRYVHTCVVKYRGFTLFGGVGVCVCVLEEFYTVRERRCVCV